uniref:DUF2975 domain-containing protein n=1 Tax=Roseivirga sp. TaxID=1964215 RepID=UPI004048AC68
MNVTKVTLWTTNAAIILIVLVQMIMLLIKFWNIDTNQQANAPNDLRGVLTKTVKTHMETLYYDLDYFFVFRDGEVVVDEHFLSPKGVYIQKDFIKSSTQDFIKVNTQGKTYNMPVNGVKIYLPIDTDKTAAYTYVSIFINILWSALLITVLVWVRRLILNFIDGDFFNVLNYKLIARIGLLFILSAVILYLGQLYFFNSTPIAMSLPEGYSISSASMTFEWNYLYLGLLLLATAQAFKHGIKLQEEQDLTI